MDKELKEDPVMRAGLSYVVQLVTGEQEFSRRIELVLRGGGVRGGRPSIPADVDLKVIKRLIRPALPSDGVDGTLYLDSNLGVVTGRKLIT